MLSDVNYKSKMSTRTVYTISLLLASLQENLELFLRPFQDQSLQHYTVFSLLMLVRPPETSVPSKLDMSTVSYGNYVVIYKQVLQDSVYFNSATSTASGQSSS